jgi:hypothetical protein
MLTHTFTYRLIAGFCRVRHDTHFFLPPQDKLTKSLTYILGNQDTVQTQICELEETVRHTEVREIMDLGPGPCLGVEEGDMGGHATINLLPAKEALEGCTYMGMEFVDRNTSAPG